MTSPALAASDAATMVRRNFRHILRYPVTVVMIAGVPVVLLLLFVGVFGGAISTGGAGRPGHYIDYLVPGILIMTVGYGASTTALAVNRDMTEGIINRFRTMPISRTSVLTGHVVAALTRTMVSLTIVVAVALLLGFRSPAGLLPWFGTAGILALLVLALTWLAVAVGLAAASTEGASGFTIVVQVLPFMSSAFVPTDAMSAPVRWFAGHEPYTPIIDTVRGLLTGTATGGTALVAVGWCLALALAGYVWARLLFRRDPVR